jgi:L-aspartate oxidase
VIAHDVVIVGGGLAGLFCALKLAPRPVTVVTAAPLGQGASSGWAQGGIAAAVAEGDTPENHARDTVAAGAGIVDAAAALAMAREAPARIADLLSFGVPFDRSLEGRLMVSREAAHSARRIVRVKGDTAGRAIMASLTAAVRGAPSIRVLDGFSLEDLLVESGTVRGVRARSIADGGTAVLAARAVVLATGGIGGLYAVTTNPPEARGDGLAAAARAGAVLADTEFVQFHPTAIAIGRDPAPLATEALRGEGAILVNRAGERFMPAIHPDAELGPRDVVARGVFAEIAAGRGAFLDARSAILDFAERFPTVHASCRSAGIDPARDLIPVAPAEHYHMGGVAVDARGRTSLDRLWAAGEVAATGVHGANRLASNSLLEAVVYAARIAEDISGLPGLRDDLPGGAVRREGEEAPVAACRPDNELREVMSQKVGVVRDADGLAHALRRIVRLERASASAAERNVATAALLVAAAAWRRRESRGGHFRSDHPAADPAQARRTFLTLQDARTTAREATEPSHERVAAA